jgi:OFA family oxalate/formate antiporter-like MFS transporter
MTEVASQEAGQVKNHGWTVTLAGFGINMALGVLYTWSVISKAIPDEWGWDEADKSLPYATACLVFCLVMVPAGRLQDKVGPRLVASVGGVLVGLGMLLAALWTTDPIGYVIGFGILAGAGIGFGYASATPPAVKWFPSAKTGMIAGIVVSGFGLASVYAAPLAKWLAGNYGLDKMMMCFAVAFLIIVVGLAQLLKAPPKGMQFVKGLGQIGAMQKDYVEGTVKEDFSAGQMLKTWQFYVVWFMYACGAGAGLMVIGKLAAIAKIQAGIELGFVLVAVLAIGNGGGRIIAGLASDKIGRKPTLIFCFLSQAVLVFLLSRAVEGSLLASTGVMALLSALIGANYGANLALFPSITKDYYGLKNFGLNYGLVFTSWGIGGFMLSRLAGSMYVKYETFNIAYYGAAILLIMAALTTLALRPPHRETKTS